MGMLRVSFDCDFCRKQCLKLEMQVYFARSNMTCMYIHCSLINYLCTYRKYLLLITNLFRIDAGKTDLVRHGSDSNISEDSGMDNISLDSLSVNCQCPCGVTDFSHYLCPPPDCLANRHSSNEAFPELDLGADKKAGSVLQQHLAEETESIQHKFTSYSMSVYHWAKSIRGIDDSLKQILRTRQQTIRSDKMLIKAFIPCTR